MSIKLKRVYDEVEKDDGYRVLVDRLWPRGVKKLSLDYDAWLNVLAPSNELRVWYHKAPEKRWNEFSSRYRIELREDDTARTLHELTKRARNENVTLLTATKDVQQSYLSVLLQEMQ